MKTTLLILCGTACLLMAFPSYAASTLQFTTNRYSVAESAGTLTLTVQREGDTGQEVRVDYATADGTAVQGLKYTAVSGTLTFAASETHHAIEVPITNDALVSGSRNFKVLLRNPVGGADLGSRSTATVSIIDSDLGIQFQLGAYAITEDAGAVLIGIVRGDDGNVPVTLTFATANGTAMSGVDYAGTTNTLSFAPNERLKFVPITILNNSLKQPDRTFRATLSNPTGGALGNQQTTTVTILDNDQGVQFESGKLNVAEDAGVALVRVLRGSDHTNVLASVDYATVDGTAVSGRDYTHTRGTLAFRPGENEKIIAVPIINNAVADPLRSFSVVLSHPTGGAVLASGSTNTVWIADNDRGVGFGSSLYTSAWGNPGMITLTVLRGNDQDLGPIKVHYETSDGTAKAGEDYQAASGTLEFLENETAKDLNIGLLRPRPTGSSKSFRVTLGDPGGGAILGVPTTATVWLVGSYVQVAPVFEPAFTVQRDWGVNVLRWNGSGQLQRADRIAGPWTTLPGAHSPTTVLSPVPTSFYRVTGPRPTGLYIPSSYDGETPMPLVIMLHWLFSDGAGEEEYMRLLPLAAGRGFLCCFPDAMRNTTLDNVWSSTDAIADLGDAGVDDAGYLRGVVEEISRRFTVDRKRIYVIGDILGGFMAYRMACQSADLIAGIATLNAGTFLDPSRCVPSEPVNILHIHGNADTVTSYYGGAFTKTGQTFEYEANMPPFPGAERSVQIWAAYNGSSRPMTEPAPTLDLTTDVQGLDTVVTRYTNAPPGGAVELWTVNGGGHHFSPSTELSPRIIDWLFAHPKP